MHSLAKGAASASRLCHPLSIFDATGKIIYLVLRLGRCVAQRRHRNHEFLAPGARRKLLLFANQPGDGQRGLVRRPDRIVS